MNVVLCILSFQNLGKDEFGIEYHHRQLNTALMSDPIVVVKREIVTNVSVDEEYDEFDVLTENSADSATAIQKALESAAGRSRNDDKAFAESAAAIIADSIASSMAQSADNDSNNDLPQSATEDRLKLSSNAIFRFDIVGDSDKERAYQPAANQTASIGKSTSAVLEARKAFQDIAEVYGSGVGDHSIALMDSSGSLPIALNSKGDEGRDAVSSASVRLGDKANLKITAIEEEDEEAAELEEMEEEMQELKNQENKQLLVDEWDSVNIVEQQVNVSTSLVPIQSSESSGNIFSKWNYEKAIKYLETINLSIYESAIVTTTGEKKSTGWFGGGIKELNFAQCKSALQFPFLVAQVDYDPVLIQHLHMLLSIFVSLYGPRQSDGSSTSSLGVVGKHWELIGFQGSDPRTDLNRSMKMLTIVLVSAILRRSQSIFLLLLLRVLQMINLIDNDPTLARTAYRMSTAVAITQPKVGRPIDLSWPFMCVSIMFTKEALQALRSGVLNDICNKEKAIMPVLGRFHAGCFYYFLKYVRHYRMLFSIIMY